MTAREHGDAADGPKRVVGVIEDFRQDGEFAAPENVLFQRMPSIGDTTTAVRPQHMPNHRVCVRSPGTTAAFEETLFGGSGALAPDWSFDVAPLERGPRAEPSRRSRRSCAAGDRGAFLLLMVALGLTGVVWQSVTAAHARVRPQARQRRHRRRVQRQVLAGAVVLLASLADR